MPLFIRIVLKRQELAYGIQAVFKEHLPSLKHGSDGLIFTSAEAPYTAGTDRKMFAHLYYQPHRDKADALCLRNSLKWKPPEENSVDFVLEIRFPPSREDPEKPDFYGKPLFMLLMNHGSEHRYFDTMQVDDETWEQWKQSGEQYDNRVVECVWDFQKENWKILRFRDDKYEGNYKNVVMSILKSVKQRITSERVRLSSLACSKRRSCLNDSSSSMLPESRQHGKRGKSNKGLQRLLNIIKATLLSSTPQGRPLTKALVAMAECQPKVTDKGRLVLRTVLRMSLAR